MRVAKPNIRRSKRKPQERPRLYREYNELTERGEGERRMTPAKAAELNRYQFQCRYHRVWLIAERFTADGTLNPAVKPERD